MRSTHLDQDFPNFPCPLVSWLDFSPDLKDRCTVEPLSKWTETSSVEVPHS